MSRLGDGADRRSDYAVVGEVVLATTDAEEAELDRFRSALDSLPDGPDRPSPDWQEASFVGNWFIRLTPREADELGRKLFGFVDELRRRPARRGGAQVLVSISLLPARPRTPVSRSRADG